MRFVRQLVPVEPDAGALCGTGKGQEAWGKGGLLSSPFPLPSSLVPLALLLLALASPTAQAQAPGDLVVNEIMYDPPAGGSGNEWIEIFNRSDQAFDLQGLTVTDSRGSSPPAESVTIAPGGFVVLANDADAFAATYPGVAFTALNLPALNNSGDRVGIVIGGQEIDAVPYESSWGGTDAALERKDPAGPSTVAVNWATATTPAGTPGAQNSQFEQDTDGPQLVSASGSIDGRTVTAELDEPVDPSTVSRDDVLVTDASVIEVSYSPGSTSIELTLAAPLASGMYTVAFLNLADLLGNETSSTRVAFTFEADETAPGLASASVASPTTVEVAFTEAVTPESAGATTSYELATGDASAGPPSSVEVRFGSGGAVGATLTFASPLQERTVYTLRASGLVDRAGNVGGGSAPLFFGEADMAAPGEIVVNEIMYDPQNGSAGEYIELVNTTANRIFDLREVTYNEDPIADAPAVLTPGQILAVVSDAEAFAEVFPGVSFVVADDFDGLSNSGEAVVLRAGDATIDSVFYDPDWHRPELDDASGISLERRSVAGPSNDASNWSSSLDDERGGTPSAPNSVGVAGGEPDGDAELAVTSPFAPDDGEAAQISYTFATEASLVRARIYDAGGRFVRELEAGRLSGREGTLLWDGRGASGEQLRVGYYIVLVEAVDVAGGTTDALKATVVLARR